MRELDAQAVTQAVRQLCIDANRVLPADLEAVIQDCSQREKDETARSILCDLCRNLDAAREMAIPICQDTGMACVFLEIGQEVHIAGDLKAAVQEGVRRGYAAGWLRKSVVRDPFDRVNTGDNTPAMLYFDLVPGEQIRITVAPKGFGSENMSRIAMLRPSDGLDGVKRFVLQTVQDAGPNPCPPIVVGVGIGGTFDKAALLAKQALLRDLDTPHEDPFYRKLEQDLLEKINALGIGPQGFGGRTTALAVNILACPTHIAGLPVAVNLNCHVTRHVTEVL